MTLIQEIRQKWPARKKTFHKGDFGRIFILAGSRGMIGAADLASRAAFRSGAGLVHLGVPDAVYSIMARRLPADVMVHPFPSTEDGTFAFKGLGSIQKFITHHDVLALGPGLSRSAETTKLVRALIQKTKMPVILDADGLNAYEGCEKEIWFLKGRTILTPHPREFLRVFGGKISDDKKNRMARASEVAKKYGIILVLKGSETIVAKPDEIYVNSTGNPGMAKGGFGDVLTGILAALVGQDFSLWDSARFGVYLHGLVADQKVKQIGEVSLTASDIIDALPKVIKQVRKI